MESQKMNLFTKERAEKEGKGKKNRWTENREDRMKALNHDSFIHTEWSKQA